MSQGIRISPGYYECGPHGYFHSKIEQKIESEEIPSCLIPPLLVVYAWQLKILVKSLTQIVVKSFPLIYQHFKGSVCTFNLAETTECIFTINNRNNLHYFQTSYFQVSDFKNVSQQSSYNC